MAVKHFNLPDPGEGLVEAEIVTWKVKVGDVVKVNDIFVEIETAKSLVELPVPYAGTVTALLASEGDTVEVGTPIISIDDGLGGDVAPAPPTTTVAGISNAATATATTAGDQSDAATTGGAATGERVANLVGYGPRVTSGKRRARKGASAAAITTAQVNQAFSPVPAQPESLAAQPVSFPSRGKALAKPPVRKFAKDLGIDLAQVTGSGEGGIVTRADVQAYAAGGGAAAGNGAASSGYLAPEFASTGERETRIPIKGVRKVTAQAMVETRSTDSVKLVEHFEKGAKFGLMKTREGYFRKADHQMMHEMYTVQALPAAQIKNAYDIFRSSAPVPGPTESLEVIASTAEENECKMA